MRTRSKTFSYPGTVREIRWSVNVLERDGYSQNHFGRRQFSTLSNHWLLYLKLQNSRSFFFSLGIPKRRSNSDKESASARRKSPKACNVARKLYSSLEIFRSKISRVPHKRNWYNWFAVWLALILTIVVFFLFWFIFCYYFESLIFCSQLLCTASWPTLFW